MLEIFLGFSLKFCSGIFLCWDVSVKFYFWGVSMLEIFLWDFSLKFFFEILLWNFALKFFWTGMFLWNFIFWGISMLEPFLENFLWNFALKFYFEIFLCWDVSLKFYFWGISMLEIFGLFKCSGKIQSLFLLKGLTFSEVPSSQMLKKNIRIFLRYMKSLSIQVFRKYLWVCGLVKHDGASVRAKDRLYSEIPI